MDLPELVATIAGSTGAGAIATVAVQYLRGKSADRKVEAEADAAKVEAEARTEIAARIHDERISPALLERIGALEARLDDAREDARACRDQRLDDRVTFERLRATDRRRCDAELANMRREVDERAVDLARLAERVAARFGEDATGRHELLEIARRSRTHRSTPPPALDEDLDGGHDPDGGTR